MLLIRKKARYNMNTEQEMKLKPQEKKLIQLIRTIGYGEVHIFIKDNKPFRIEEIKKSIRLDE